MKKLILILAFIIFPVVLAYTQVNHHATNATGNYASAIGDSTSSIGYASFASGLNSIAMGDFSFASGWNINLNGISSFSLGYGNSVDADGAAALGTISSAMGTGAFAIGNKVDALMPYSFAIGKGQSNGHLENNISNSLMIGFESDIPTFFVGSAYGTGTLGKIGIGTTDPGSRLQVNGNMAVGYNQNTNAPDNGMVVNGTIGIGTSSPGNAKLHIDRNNSIGVWGNMDVTKSILRLEGLNYDMYLDDNTMLTDGTLQLGTLTDYDISFGTNNEERVKITHDGNVGIGVEEPNEQLEVNGNILLKTPDYGIILKSPDGSEWKLKVDNNGEMLLEPVSAKSNRMKDNSNLFPNPSQNIIHLNLVKSDITYPVIVEIFDMKGSKVFMCPYNNPEISINVSALENGTYFVKVKDNKKNEVISKKLIKQ